MQCRDFLCVYKQWIFKGGRIRIHENTAYKYVVQLGVFIPFLSFVVFVVALHITQEFLERYGTTKKMVVSHITLTLEVYTFKYVIALMLHLTPQESGFICYKVFICPLY